MDSSEAGRKVAAHLAAAIHPTRPAPEALVAGGQDATVWLDLLPRHRVAGLVARALESAGLIKSLGDEARLRLQRLVMHDQRERAALDRAMGVAVATLAGAGIESILLKGAALGMTLYREGVLRPMSDVDLLVRETALAPALDALAAAGFGLPDARDRAFWREAYYNLPTTAPGAGAVSVEMHWSIAQERHRPDLEGLFARAREAVKGERSYRVFSLPDLLLHQVLHHAYHTFQPKLIWIHDLALVHLTRPPLGESTARARAWGMSIPLALSCRQVEKVFPGVVAAEWVAWGRRQLRARALGRCFASREPLGLLSRWQQRRWQLLYAFLMIDRPYTALRGLAAWAHRSRRFGDREGHERLAQRRQ